MTENSGRERTTAFCYAVGWTHHTVGAQYIRTASILQALLGNIGRPGGGILALRGHASIQGSTDIPTLFNILPGYIPMPHAHAAPRPGRLRRPPTRARPGSGATCARYAVSLLKAWWGDARDRGQRLLLRLPATAHRRPLHVRHGDAPDRRRVPGYFLVGENPAVGSANAKMQRLGMANLDWLVVRDLQMIESATFWKDGPEIETGELRTEDIGTEVFFLPAASHTEKDGTFTNTQRLLQWHHKAVEPPGDCPQRPVVLLPPRKAVQRKLAATTDPRDRPLLDLTWDYPDDEHGDPSADAVLRRSTATARTDRCPATPRSRTTARPRRLLDLLRRLRRRGQPVRAPQARQRADLVAPEWGWAWPAEPPDPLQPRVGRPGRQAVERAQDASLVGRRRRQWTGADIPDFAATTAPDYVPPDGARRRTRSAATSRSSCRPTAGRGCSRRPGSPTGRCRRTTSRRSPLWTTRSTASRRTRRQERYVHRPTATTRCRAEVFPYVFTTYRLTEHHTAGGMSRTLLPDRAAAGDVLEVSPELAARTRPGARGLGARRHRALRDRGPGAGDRAGGRCGSAGARSTRSACPATGARTDCPPGTRPTSCCRWRWTRTCTSRRRRPPPATSARAGARAARRCSRSWPTTGGAPGSGGGADGQQPCPDRSTTRRRRGSPRGAPATRRVLHRHQRLHRLQGLRGGVQGVERAARRRRRYLLGHELRQHRRAGRDHLPARRVRRAAGRRARSRPRDADGRRAPARTAPTPPRCAG